jgi:hypothetical protein
MGNKEMETTELTSDEKKVITAYRATKAKGHGEVTVAVRHGAIVKLWTIDKWDRDDESKSKLKEPTQ